MSQIVIGSGADLLACLRGEPNVVLGTLLRIAQQPERARSFAEPEIAATLRQLAEEAEPPELRAAAERAWNAYEGAAPRPEREPEIRARRLARLAQEEGEAALPSLTEALDDHWLVRAAATRALLALGEPGRAVLAAHPRPELRALIC